MDTYAKRLQYLMDERGETISSIARVLGVTYPAVQKVFKNDAAFGSKNNILVAEHFGVSPTWLATGKGPMTGKQDLPPLSPSAIALGRLLDQLPMDDITLWASVYQQATQIIASAIEKTQPKTQPDLDPKSTHAQRQDLPASS